MRCIDDEFPQLKIADWFDGYSFIDRQQNARADEDLPEFCFIQRRDATFETVPIAA